MSYRRRLPPNQPPSGPWSNRLVFFSVLDSGSHLRSLIQGVPGTSTKPTDQETVYGTAGYPGLHFLDSNGEYVDWEKTAFTLTGSVTFLGRWKIASASGNLGSLLGTWTQSPQNGFMVYFNDAGGPDQGIAAIAGEGGSVFFTATGTPATYRGVEMTLAARYDATARRITVYRDGVSLLDATDVSTAWNTTFTTNFSTGNVSGTTSRVNADIFWVAAFNRALTDAEMAAWTTRDPFDLVWGGEGVMPAVSPPGPDTHAWTAPRFDFHYLDS